MRVEYQCTAEDFVEACSQFATRVAGLPSAAMLAMGVGQLVSALTTPASPTETAPAGATIANVLTWLGIVVAFWFFALRLMTREPGAKPSQRYVWLVRTLAIVVWVAVFWTNVAMDPARGVAAGLVALILSLPWGLLVWLLSAMLGRLQRRAFLAHWKDAQYLHVQQSLEVTEGGVRIESAIWTWEYQWRAIRGLRQTPALVLLMLSRTGFVMVPRRAFDSAEEVDRFIATAQANTQTAPLPIPPPNAAAIPVATRVTARDEAQA